MLPRPMGRPGRQSFLGARSAFPACIGNTPYDAGASRGGKVRFEANSGGNSPVVCLAGPVPKRGVSDSVWCRWDVRRTRPAPVTGPHHREWLIRAAVKHQDRHAVPHLTSAARGWRVRRSGQAHRATMAGPSFLLRRRLPQWASRTVFTRIERKSLYGYTSPGFNSTVRSTAPVSVPVISSTTSGLTIISGLAFSLVLSIPGG
jgi:hypothetical protein